MNRFLNPFKPLTEQLQRIVSREGRDRDRAEWRMRQAVSSYRALLQDPRYRLVRSDAQAILQEQVERLVEEAARCPRCVVYAERIRVLKDVVLLPVQVGQAATEEARSQEHAEQSAQDEADVL